MEGAVAWWEARQRLMMARSEQQLLVERSLAELRKAPPQAPRGGKKSLACLEGRVRLMRASLRGEARPFAENEVDSLVPHKVRRREATPESDEQCRFCGRFVPELNLHESECKRRRKESSVATAPQAPRNVRIGRATATELFVEWEPPILDGGSAVLEYEIKLGEKRMKTTSFCLADPVADFGFRITDLAASEEYSLCVRCSNDKGWSAESATVIGVTKSAIAPSKPLFVTCSEPTATEIAVRWSPPFSDGGAQIEEYVLSYTETRHLTITQHIAEFGRRGADASRRAEYAIPATKTTTTTTPNGGRCCCCCCEWLMRGLRAGSDYSKISVRAINAAKLSGAAWVSRSTIRTLAPTVRLEYEDELRRARGVEGPLIDTDFYGGVLQREVRADYVARLELELEKLPVDVEPPAPPEILRLRRSVCLDDEDEPRPVRIEKKKKSSEWQQAKNEFASRVAIGRELASLRARVSIVEAELDRVAPLTASFVNSAVIHGSDQRFPKPQLQRDLETELERCLGSIARAKRTLRRREKPLRLVVSAAAASTTKKQQQQEAPFSSSSSGEEEERRRKKEELRCALRSFASRLARSAFEKWRKPPSREISSRGSRLLTLAKRRRSEVATRAQFALEDLAPIHEELGNETFTPGDAWLRRGNLSEAIEKYAAKKEFSKIGSAYAATGDHTKALVALEGLGRFDLEGRSRMALFEYRAAIRAFERAGDAEGAAEARTRRDGGARTKKKQNSPTKFQVARQRLDGLVAKIQNAGLERGTIIELQRESRRAMRLRDDQKKFREDIQNLKEAGQEQGIATAKISDVRTQIAAEIQVAKSSDEDQMESALVHGRAQAFEIEELKVRLMERYVQVGRDLEASRQAEIQIRDKILSLEDRISERDEELKVETGDLMRSVVLKKQPVRLVALNAAAGSSNNNNNNNKDPGLLLCTASGTVVSLFDLKLSGKMVKAFDSHSKHVTALYFFQRTVYSGGADHLVIRWSIDDDDDDDISAAGGGGGGTKLEGHEGTVTAVCCDAARAVSGSADAKIRVWQDARCVRVLHGHLKSPLALQVGPSWLASAGLDGARLWRYHRGEKKTCSAPRSFQGRITAIKYGALELIGGLADGSLAVWWLADGELVQTAKPHAKGPVFGLEFDATRVVSCAADGLVAVTDLTTGSTLQSLRGHEGAVLAVAYDSSRVLSVGSDGTAREWKWISGGQEEATNKYHIVDSRDTLGTIARKYDVKVKDLARWNNLTNARDVYAGTRLLVAPEQQQPNPANRRRREYTAAAGGGLLWRRRRSSSVKNKTKTPSRIIVADRTFFDPKSQSGRVYKAIDPTALDADRSMLRRMKRPKSHGLGNRISSSIGDAVDEFGQVAANRRDDEEKEKRRRSREEKDDAAARAGDATRKTLAERRLDEKSRAVYEEVLFLCLSDVLYSIAGEAAKTSKWNESLAGRIAGTAKKKTTPPPSALVVEEAQLQPADTEPTSSSMSLEAGARRQFVEPPAAAPEENTFRTDARERVELARQIAREIDR
ncbi:hypothetical protein CTAYLR_009338 [Chrysophaeum taylorii]|uniref:Uncharacterized protein n=1 Tax=Chrysophaeum taylorii TaxID=2483200 RepID=A0AAD7XM20_9STRA|nr:hypothetical protein CTAYLR_009338 [Chrysophaeum taylorii]